MELKDSCESAYLCIWATIKTTEFIYKKKLHVYSVVKHMIALISVRGPVNALAVDY